MSQSQRYRELQNRYLDGLADEDELRELAEHISADEAAASQFAQAVRLDGLLSRSFSGQQQDDEVTELLASLGVVEQVIDSAELPNESTLGKAARAIHWRTHPGRFLSLAALLTVAFVTAFFAIVWPRLGEEKIAQGPEQKIAPPVAQLVRTRDAEWEGEAPDPGEALREGRQLQLKSGLAQILFRDGASVILEGPAVFSTATTNSGRLVRGLLVASCETERARGFAIATPHARVEDIGTQFAVDVREDGAAEFFVLSGQVVVTSTGGGDEQDPPRMQLSKGQGASVAAGGGRIASQGNIDLQRLAEYRKRVERISKPSAGIATRGLSIHYRADNVDGRGNPGTGTTTRLVNLATPGKHDGTIVAGSGVTRNSGQAGTPYEYGIVLTGNDQTHIQADTYQIAGGTNKVTGATWEFWLRADRGMKVNRGALYGEFPASNEHTRHYLRLDGIGSSTRALRYDEFSPSGGSATSDSQLHETGVFTQIVVTKSGDRMAFYKNGVAAGAVKSHSETYSGGAIVQTLFGKRASQNESFDGQFNIIRVYDRALKPSEVKANYQTERGNE